MVGFIEWLKSLFNQEPEVLPLFKKPKRKVTRVFIHCSASDKPEHDSVGVIREWHLANGWNDIGYHWFINKWGLALPGRDIEKTPAAQKGNNTGTIAICLSGLAYFSEDQFNTLRKLCREINAAYNGEITFHGHCEVSNKACPVFDYKNVLNLDDNGRIGAK